MKKLPFLLPILLLVIINLLVGLVAGLGRMGWELGLSTPYVNHGGIMVGGFMGTLISLEKAIPLKKRIYLIIPLLSCVSVGLFALHFNTLSFAFLIASSVGFVLMFIAYGRRHFDPSIVLSFLASCFLLVGNILLLSKNFYPMAVPWWMGFILFIIVGERLELSKFLPVTAEQKKGLYLFLSMYVLGIILPFHGVGTYFSGASLVLISLWLMRFDIVSINLKRDHLVKYTGVVLLCGYVSLLFTGIFLFALKGLANQYDIVLHTFFLGFAFLMIFAHGPIILPSVIGFAVRPFHKLLYGPPVLLLLSLIVRILADLYIVPVSLQLVSGYFSAAAILLYFITLIYLVQRAIRNATSV